MTPIILKAIVKSLLLAIGAFNTTRRPCQARLVMLSSQLQKYAFRTIGLHSINKQMLHTVEYVYVQILYTYYFIVRAIHTNIATVFWNISIWNITIDM